MVNYVIPFIRNSRKDKLWLPWGRGLTVKGHKGTFWGWWNVLDLDCGAGYAILYSCQDSLNSTLKISEFCMWIISQLILRKEEDLMYSFVNLFYIYFFLYSLCFLILKFEKLFPSMGYFFPSIFHFINFYSLFPMLSWNVPRICFNQVE